MTETKKKLIVINIFSLATIAILFGLIFLFKNNASFDNNLIVNDFASGGSGRGREGGTRITYNFNYGWTFSKGSGYLNSGLSGVTKTPVTVIPNPTVSSNELDIPYSLTYDETHLTGTSSWKNVSLPHTYNDEDTFDDYMEKGLIGERRMYSGTAWYKKTFSLPSSYSTGKKIIIEFEAARQAAKVWVNGHELTGLYENGFIAFGYEIPTEYLNFGDTPNDITVLTDNSYPYYMNGTNSAISWHDSHWHPNYGGLYRNSYLYVVDDLHLTIPLYSFTEGVGTYVYTDTEVANATHVHVDAEVKNSSNNSRTFSYRALIKDMTGQTVLTINSPSDVTLLAGESHVYQMEGVLLNPKRWSIDYPYLYTCEVEIIENDVLIDNNLNTFGVRTFRITNDDGFYLNEYYTELDGWGQKPTWEWAVLGAAYPNWMTDDSVKMLKDAEGNYLRFGHSAGSITQIEMCDKYGILVTQPGVDGEGQSDSGGANSYDGNTYRLRTEAMRDMIVYFRNHPSIIMWEMGNQAIGLQNVASDSFLSNIEWLNYDTTSYPSATYASILFDVIEKYDYGNRNSDALISNAGSYDDTETSSNRLIAIRRGTAYVKDYVDVAETTDGSGGMTTLALGKKPSVEGEYNRFEARRGVWDKSTEGFQTFTNITSEDDTNYINSTSESFAISQIYQKLNVLNSTSNVGGANWIFSDTNSHGRLQSEVARASGEVDAVMLPKESYYVSKVLNSDEIGMHIIGHWNYPAATVKDISVVAKGVERVELFVNGISVGDGTKSHTYLYTFSDVTYVTGYVEAVGYDGDNNILITKRISSHGAPTQLQITGTNGPGGLKATGSDVLILDVELLDSEGNICVSYDGEIQSNLLTFTYDLTDNITGEITGEWLGGYNSSIPTNTRQDSLYLEAGLARVFIRTSENAGTISVTASMQGINPDTYETTSVTQLNENGLSTDINETRSYALIEDNNIGLGSGAIGGAEIVFLPTSKLYTENSSYSGMSHTGNGIDDAFSIGEYVYSDSGVTISTLPYKFINAELFRYPNADRGTVAEDLLVFDVTRNVTVFVARDSRVQSPNWLTSEYTLTTDHIECSNGVTYDVWAREVTVTIDQNNNVVNETIVIGGNSDNGTMGLLGANQFVFVKPTDRVQQRDFFKQDFELFSESNVLYGYNGFIPDANTSIYRDTVASRTGLRFIDNASPDLAYIEKEFASLDKPFIFEYKAYVANIPGIRANNWLRVLLSHDYLENVDSLDNIGVESYLYKEEDGGNKLYLKYRTTINGKSTLVSAIDSPNVTVNNWYIYEYHVNPIDKNWQVFVYDETGTNLLASSEIIGFAKTSYVKDGQTININSLNTLTFGTGKNALYLTDYLIDDLTITPDMGIGATSITVNGNTINLDENTNSYITLDGSTPSEAIVSLNLVAQEYYQYTRTDDDVNGIISFDIENQIGEHFTFDVVFDGTSILDEWTVVPTQKDPDVSVTGAVRDNSSTIHINDTSDTKNTYIYKSIPSNTSSLKFSLDVYLTDDVDYNQQLIKLFLSNGELDTIDDFSKLGVRSYLTNQDATTNEFVMATKQVNLIDTNHLDDTLITKNAWHTLDYFINVANQKYSVTLDGVKIIDNFDFYTTVPEINNIYIGTDTVGTADIYLRNIEYEAVSGKPIDGVIINEENLPNFDSESDTYIYYTDEALTNDTVITPIANSYTSNLIETVITKDLINKTVILDITDTFGDVFTYTIIFTSPLDRTITSTQLQELVDHAENDYVSSDYTINTWANVIDKVTEANRILDLGSAAKPREYSQSYYELEQALSNLLRTYVYDKYLTATVETIHYSGNLRDENNEELFSFNKVLDNRKQVYFGDELNTFTSVPYMYMNAEYLLVTNDTYRNALISLKILKEIDILVFKDRDAGPFTEDGFIYTGEIATTSDGVIYKIYKKTFSVVGETINLEFEKMVNNFVTGNNNIIAFIETYKANNDYFFHEDFDTYDVSNLAGYSSDELYKRSWENFDASSYADNELQNNIDGRNALRLYSSTLYGQSTNTANRTEDGWGITYKEIAELYETMEFKYSFKTVSGANNEFIRTWLRDDKGYYEDTTDSDKVHTALELYIHGSQMAAQIGASRTKLATISAGTFFDTTTTINLKEKLFTFKLNNGNTSVERSTVNKSGTGNNTSLDSVNHVYFASRYTWSTDVFIRDVQVTPIPSGFYSDLLVSNTSIGNYQDLTKAYLYKLDTPTDYENATGSAVAGTLFTSNSLTSNPTVTTNCVSCNVKYTNINEQDIATTLVNRSYSRDYTVYYEVDSDSSTTPGTHGKDELVDLVRIAQDLNPNLYPTLKFAVVETALANAINRLANHTTVIDDVASTDDVTGDYIALYNAIQALQFNYVGLIEPNKIYGNITNEETNITNKSSFTANFSVEVSSNEYLYEDAVHERFLTLDVTPVLGTKITMIDKSNTVNKYYYYIVTQEDINLQKVRFPLSEFLEMGTTDNYFINAYNYANNIFKDEYSFIFDFSETSGAAVGDHTINLELFIDDVKVTDSITLTYTIYNEETPFIMDVSFGNESYYDSENIDLNINVVMNEIISNNINVTDTTYSDLLIGLRLTLKQDGQTITFPKGTVLIFDDITYTLNANGTLHISKGSSVSSLNRNFIISPGFDDFQPGEYTILVELIGSYDGINEGLVLASKTEYLTILEKPNCSIYSHVINGTSLVDLSESSQLHFSIDTVCNNVQNNKIITVKLLKKAEIAFNNFTYNELDYLENVNNSVAIPYLSQPNVYQLKTYPNTAYNKEEFTDTFVANLKNTMPSGTYKLQFDVRAGDIIMSDDLSFVVK